MCMVIRMTVFRGIAYTGADPQIFSRGVQPQVRHITVEVHKYEK